MSNKEELLNKLEAAKTLEELEKIKSELRNLQEEEKAAETENVAEEEVKTEAETTETVNETEEKAEMSEEEERSLLSGTEKTNKNIEIRNVLKGEDKMEENKINEVLEQRGADLKAGKKISVSMEERSQTVATGVLLNKKYKNNIDETFDAVSGIVDEMNTIALNGGESYSVPFEIGYDEGGYTTEGGDYADVDIETDYVETGRAKITAYTEITKEYKKLPNANYVALVTKHIRDAIKRKIGAQAIVGAGTSNTIKGIYNANTKVLTGAADIELSGINQDTLNKLVFAYGGNEAVEGTQKLILSKKDLEEFSKVKFTDGRFVYKITKNGKTGTISYVDGGVSVDYIINSACNSIVDSSSLNKFTMIYGSLNSFELPIFSDLEIEESTDAQFKKGLIAYRGDIIVGGTVSKYNGFVRVKKVAAV